MKTPFLVGALTAAMLATSCMAQSGGGSSESGIPVGGMVSAFHPLNVTGEHSGNNVCLV